MPFPIPSKLVQVAPILKDSRVKNRPSIAFVEQDMQERRSVREDMLREDLFAEALRYVSSINRAINQSVTAAAVRVKAQYGE